MALQVRRGNESDFDPTKMLPGEWAVSLDTKYVRMCFSPGICLRMATYEAFETDMAEIQSIMAEARTIEEAVARIQMEINDTAVVVENYAILSKSYAVGGTGTRAGEDVDNAKYYYEQAKYISQGGNGLVPLGSIAFENLPTEDIVTNAMYNINNDFTSDERFVDGGGILYGKGSNIFYTADGKWDVLAASDVKGVKGEEEETFRQGNVNITAENIGLGTVKQDIADIGTRLGENVEDLQSQIDAANSNLESKSDCITDCNTIAELVNACELNKPFVFHANSSLMNELAGITYAGVGYGCKVAEGVVDGTIEYNGGTQFASFRIVNNTVSQWKEYAKNSDLATVDNKLTVTTGYKAVLDRTSANRFQIILQQPSGVDVGTVRLDFNEGVAKFQRLTDSGWLDIKTW